MEAPTTSPRPFPDCPLVAAYGLGVDSTAMLIEFVRRNVRPDLILFADTGAEKPETYSYLPIIQRYLADVGFPGVVTVRYQPKTAVYHTLEGQCLHTGTLPSLAYGGKSCSLKFKRAPQDKFILARYSSRDFVRQRRRVVRAIGFEAGEERRTFVAHVVKAIGLDAGEEHHLTWARSTPDKPKLSRDAWLDQHFYAYWYPLLDWSYNRERCKQIIADAGLPIPVKSACYFCPASKKREIAWLEEHHPDLLQRALEIERNAQAKLRTVKGLGRSFAWEGYVSQRLALPLLDHCDG